MYFALLDGMYLWNRQLWGDEEWTPFGATILCSGALFLNVFLLFNVVSILFGMPFMPERWHGYAVGVSLAGVNGVVAYRRYRHGTLGLRLDRNVVWGSLRLLSFARLYMAISVAFFFLSFIPLWGVAQK